MAITTQYGNEIILTDREGSGTMTMGEFVHGTRVSDNQRRSYRAGLDLRAPGGIAEIAAIVEALPHTKVRTMTPKEQSKKDKTAYRLHNTPDGHALATRKRLERSRKYGKDHSDERSFIDLCEREGIIVRPLPKWY